MRPVCFRLDQSEQLTRGGLRRLLGSVAPIAAGLWMTSGQVAAQSIWDRAPLSPTALYTEHQTADYHVDQAPPVDVWAGSHSTWTAIDVTGRDLRPAVIATPAAPAASPEPMVVPSRVDAATPRTTGVSLPESVIRSSLQSSLRPPITAGALLRGPVSMPQPIDPEAGVARLKLDEPQPHLAVSPAAAVPEPFVEPLPVQETEELAVAVTSLPTDARVEERTFSLFDPPAVVDGQSLTGDMGIADTWRSALAGVEPAGGGEPLSAPTSDTLISAAPIAPREGVVMLDGLDAVNGEKPPRNSPYEPIPLTQIRPYKSYSPDGITLCPDPAARCPDLKELPGGLGPHERVAAHLDFLWVPANVFYSPLYFEDPALERYGHTHGPLLQPFASTTRFGMQLISLPYQVALDPPHRRVYPLGFYRPGECAPKQVPNVPLNAKAAAAAGAVYTGLIFAFP